MRTPVRLRRLTLLIEGELPLPLLELIAMDTRVKEHSLVDVTDGEPLQPAKKRFLDIGSERSLAAQKEILEVMGSADHHYSDFAIIAAKHGFQSGPHGLLCKLKERGLVHNTQRGMWAKT